MPVGFKNLTSGNWLRAIDGILASQDSHSFLSMETSGRVAHVKTEGNPACHVVLRGGEGSPNYHTAVIDELVAFLEKEKVETGIMIDCSHANSGKNHLRQNLVAMYARRLHLSGGHRVRGLMIESNINPGRQNLVNGKAEKPGVSITDACIGWESTVLLLNTLDQMTLRDISTLEEARAAIREYDELILNTANASTLPPPPKPEGEGALLQRPEDRRDVRLVQGQGGDLVHVG
jgi:3-deoxy-7-phosphoheptulonate synthase